MRIRTLIVDDEPIALEKLRSYVEKVPFLELAGMCVSGIEAMEAIAAESIDVVFTDINMPDLTGMDMVKSLPRAPMIVFTTAYPEYAPESYRVSAVDYLLKPYSFVDFQRAVNKVRDIYEARLAQAGSAVAESAPRRDGSLFVKTDYRFVRVELASVRYIKAYGEYLQLFINGAATPVMTLGSFAGLRRSLPDNFVQIHRSYMVNMDCVEQIARARVVMDADTYLPVGDSYRQALNDYILAHGIGVSRRS